MSNKLGFGGWQLANPLWNQMTMAEAVSLVQKAYQSGVRFFDTAPNYGDGNSEKAIGEALKSYRSDCFINTKLGHGKDGSNQFGIAALKPQILDSITRLQTTYLDAVLLHNPPLEVLKSKAHFDALDTLRQEGLIKHYGVSIDTLTEFEIALSQNLDVIEILFNVFFQSPKALFDQAKEKGVMIITKVPLDSGWLTGKYDQDTVFTGIRDRYSLEQKQRRSQLVDEVKRITLSDNITPFAMQFIYSFDAISYAIPGIQNLNQLEQHVTYTKKKMSNQMKKRLEQLYNTKISDNPLPW